jgi:hypothetical protein
MRNDPLEELMLKRISLANALAVFVAASGMFLLIASTTPNDVHNLAAPVARVSAAALNAGSATEKAHDSGMKKSTQSNVHTDDAGKGAIDLGEFIIHAR